MKRKLLKAVTVLLICMAGVLLCEMLFYYVDIVRNGSFVDWFEENYMMTEKRVVTGTNAYVAVYRPDYMALKPFLLQVLTRLMVFGLLIIMAVSHIAAEIRERRTVTRISGLMRDFMRSGKTGAEYFPLENNSSENTPREIFLRKYAEISAQMTEIKASMQRHEQLLKEEASRKNDLITYLAHDLKTPLTSVIGYLSLLDEAPDMPAEQRAKYVHITLDKANRLERLINEFFDITRYNLQQIELERETIDLSYMLVQMTDEFYPLLQAHGNTTQLNVDENLTIRGDAEKLARVFNNILKNAVAYSEPHTPIRIWAEQSEKEVRIFFQNSGKTIPAHKLENIFEKFFRLDEARMSDTGGAGLGLAIAKEIVRLHGGTIGADSRENVTTFRVALPLGD